jgi:hypothetical protein
VAGVRSVDRWRGPGGEEHARRQSSTRVSSVCVCQMMMRAVGRPIPFRAAASSSSLAAAHDQAAGMTSGRRTTTAHTHTPKDTRRALLPLQRGGCCCVAAARWLSKRPAAAYPTSACGCPKHTTTQTNKQTNKQGRAQAGTSSPVQIPARRGLKSEEDTRAQIAIIDTPLRRSARQRAAAFDIFFGLIRSIQPHRRKLREGGGKEYARYIKKGRTLQNVAHSPAGQQPPHNPVPKGGGPRRPTDFKWSLLKRGRKHSGLPPGRKQRRHACVLSLLDRFIQFDNNRSIHDVNPNDPNPKVLYG